MEDTFAKRSEAYSREKKERDRRIEVLVEEARKGKKITFLVMIDGTGSMERYMKGAAKCVREMGKYISGSSDSEEGEAEVTYILVIYRDPLEPHGGENEVLVTTESSVFSDRLRRARATGGGDTCEDVAGGMKLANEALRSVGRDSSLVLAHVADAPPHAYGMEADDNHNTGKQRKRMEAEMGELAVHAESFRSFQYLLFCLKSDMFAIKDDMRDLLSSKLRTLHHSSVFKVIDPSDDFVESFSTASMSSVMASVSVSGKEPRHDHYLSTPASKGVARFGLHLGDKPSPDKICPLHPKKDFVCLKGGEVFHLSPPSSCFKERLQEYTSFSAGYAQDDTMQNMLMKAIQSSFSSRKRKLEYETVSSWSEGILFVHSSPFQAGREKLVYSCVLSEGKEKGEEEWSRKEMEEKGTKEYMVRDPVRVVMKLDPFSERAEGPKEGELESNITAMWMTQRFNLYVKANGLSLKEVVVESPILFRFTDRLKILGKSPVFLTPNQSLGFGFVLEKALVGEGEVWKKWMSNDGTRHPEMTPGRKYDPTLDALVCFVHKMTGGNAVICDLQGVEKEGKYHVTDTAFCCDNSKAFGQTNIGRFFKQKIFKASNMALKEHDPKMHSLFM